MEDVGKLRIALAVALLILLTETVGGFISHSLALLADAAHMLTDVGAAALGLWATLVATRPADGRIIRVGRRTWEALRFLAEGKDPDERIITITDERIRQILTAAAGTAGLQKKISPPWLRHAQGSHAHQRGAPAATIRDTLGHASLGTTDSI